MSDKVDLIVAEIEASKAVIWERTSQLRWFRPRRGFDTDVRLEQLWCSREGGQEWRQIDLVLED